MNMKEKKRFCDRPWLSPKSEKSTYFLYILFAFCFEPKLFAKFPALNALFAAGIAACFGIMGLLYLSSRKRPSVLLVAVGVYRASFMVQTFFAENGDFLMWGYMSVVLLTMCMAVDYYIKDKGSQLIEVVLHLLIYLLVGNLIISLLYPEGAVENLYFIGIRTRLTDVIIPMLVLAMVLDWMNRRALSFRTSLCFILALLTVLQHEVVTAILGLVILFFCYAIFYTMRREWMDSSLNVGTLAGIALTLDALIVHAQITLRMEWIFVNVLNKTATLTDRLLIWERAVDIIANKPLMGHGMAENGNFVPGPASLNADILWQAHNQWLQMLYDGGILTVLAFLAVIMVCFKGLWCESPRRPRMAFLAGLFAFFVMMSVEIFTYTPYFFVLLFIGNHANKLSRSDEPRLGWLETIALKNERYPQ